ncbi:(2Fe-2S) ferredoxin domain-containing protein [Deinococcus peraridilitoris]|uniref:Ferredoxin n=1 Tax=Deinococcus peraridilitoris (strain DSM 19664 / LMG 22246 / CIP 109416 / KR-200) TaxID=937777 RepID=L0A090_DEIPD|nr:NAD(P)H-dependent oxidoreductase subunit E [Deinococcus peraridilitoris]AFZ66869.1 ferredoxin [Deinococcus peraridilitoris DSM 19664]
MPAKYFKTNGHLLACGGSSCQQRGADLLYLALQRALDNQKLLYYKTGGSVRLTRSGCLGACSYGPTLACYRERAGQLEQAWYEAVDFPLALRVAQAVHEEAELPQERRYGPADS